MQVFDIPFSATLRGLPRRRRQDTIHLEERHSDTLSASQILLIDSQFTIPLSYKGNSHIMYFPLPAFRGSSIRRKKNSLRCQGY